MTIFFHPLVLRVWHFYRIEAENRPNSSVWIERWRRRKKKAKRNICRIRIQWRHFSMLLSLPLEAWSGCDAEPSKYNVNYIDSVIRCPTIHIRIVDLEYFVVAADVNITVVQRPAPSECPMLVHVRIEILFIWKMAIRRRSVSISQNVCMELWSIVRIPNWLKKKVEKTRTFRKKVKWRRRLLRAIAWADRHARHTHAGNESMGRCYDFVFRKSQRLPSAAWAITRNEHFLPLRRFHFGSLSLCRIEKWIYVCSARMP